MKKAIFLLFLISFGVAFIACSRDKNGNNESKERTYNFRNVRWGMSQEEVQASEKLTPATKRPDLILYRGEHDGMRALIGFNFEDKKLVRAGYLMRESYEDPNSFIKDFQRMKQQLIEEYGSPASDEIGWKEGETVEEDPEKFGEAACEGKLMYYTVWETAKSLIKLRLDGLNGKCQLGLQYESIDLFVIPRIDASMRQLAAPTPGPSQTE
jgi:hypothetical protein